jgi:Na+/H+ antiporter NhaA
MDLHDWVNDGLTTIYVFVVDLEVRRGLPLGELTGQRRIVVPLVAGCWVRPSLRWCTWR